MTAASCVAPARSSAERERSTAEWQDMSSEYRLTSRTHKAQYAQMYYARLMELSPQVRKRAQEKWPGLPAVKVLCLEHGIEQIAIGTLYKDMKLKPTVLKEYTEEVTMAQQLAADTFCDDDDALVLEDETARIKLSGAIDVSCMVTGIVLAAKGVLDERTGIFDVSDICYAGLPAQPTKSPLPAKKYVALASGLCIGEPAVDVPKTMLLMDWVKGLFGDADHCKDVVRLVICGGTQGNLDALATAPAASKQQRFAMEAVQEVDRCVTELASALPVDVMPGAGDLSNHALPQQPLHQCLFPGAAPCENFFRATNPYRFSLDGVQLLGCSGQNLHDIMRYSKTVDPIQLMSDSLMQRHLCCTAPDTLACFPYVDQDPFILRSSPHVYFVGNQAVFGEGQVTDGDKSIKLISVPSFAKTSTVVLLDLESLQCKPISFDVSL
eukprot:jgi/Ulvmu1/6149/UM028_0005.1